MEIVKLEFKCSECPELLQPCEYSVAHASTRPDTCPFSCGARAAKWIASDEAVNRAIEDAK